MLSSPQNTIYLDIYIYIYMYMSAYVYTVYVPAIFIGSHMKLISRRTSALAPLVSWKKDLWSVCAVVRFAW